MSISLINVQKSFNGRLVIDGLSLAIPDRGIIGLSGPSGCGKTTLLRLLAGLDLPDGGLIEGLNGLTVSMVFQEDRLLPWLTAAENIGVVLSDRQAALSWLDQVRLADSAEQYPAELSGGMKRRLALARALARPGGLMLLDEPFTGMDAELKTGLFGLIEAAAAARPVILVTHDREDIDSLADQLWLADGPPLMVKNSK